MGYHRTDLSDQKVYCAYIDCGGYEQAARALNVHWKTVVYRVKRFRNELPFKLDWRVKKVSDHALIRIFNRTRSINHTAGLTGISYSAARKRLRKLVDTAFDLPKIKGRDEKGRFSFYLPKKR